MVSVEIGNDLKASLQRDDLALDMLVKNSIHDICENKVNREEDCNSSRNQADAHFLVEYLKNLLACAAFQ